EALAMMKECFGWTRTWTRCPAVPACRRAGRRAATRGRARRVGLIPARRVTAAGLPLTGWWGRQGLAGRRRPWLLRARLGGRGLAALRCAVGRRSRGACLAVSLERRARDRDEHDQHDPVGESVTIGDVLVVVAARK